MNLRISETLVLLSSFVAFIAPSDVLAQMDVELEVDAEVDAETPTPVAPEASAPPHLASSPDEVAMLRAAVDRLEQRLAAVEATSLSEQAPEPMAEEPPESADITADRAPVAAPPSHWWDALDLRVSGYVQSQLVFSQLSESELDADGNARNLDRFLIRRGRLRIERTWRHASLAFEIDASTTRGPFVGIRRAETSFFYPGSHDGAPPLVMATVGLTEVPFGYELRQSNRTRWFLERSAGSLAFQRGEPDVGLRVSGGFGPFRYAFAVMNGNPLDDRPGGEPNDLTRPKDLIGRIGVEETENEHFRFRLGASFNSGTGLHRGSPATKPTILWRDTNEDGVVQTVEVTGVPGRAATPSVAFRRWAVNADLGVDIHTPIGWSHLHGEVTMASNLDRSFYVADPVATGYDLREVAWYVAFLQEITDYAVVGFRADYYDPDSDLLDTRRGTRVPIDASQLTLSPMVGAQLPGRGRIVLQYDRIRDHLGRDAIGVPTDLRNDQFVARLQMEF